MTEADGNISSRPLPVAIGASWYWDSGLRPCAVRYEMFIHIAVEIESRLTAVTCIMSPPVALTALCVAGEAFVVGFV